MSEPESVIRLVTGLMGAGVALSSAQWIASVVRLRLDLLLGWSVKTRARVTACLLLRLVAGLCLVASVETVGTAAASAIVLLSNIAIWSPMRPALHAVFRMSQLLAAILVWRGLAGPGTEADGAALFAIAAVSALSYGVTGATKLVSDQWRNGRILLVALKSRTNGCGPLYFWMKDRSILLGVTAWAVILFESFFPVSILAGYASALVFCGLGVLFHVAIALTMGMNLFLLTWGSTYPAVLFSAANITSLPSFFDLGSAWTLTLIGWLSILVIWQLAASIPAVRRRRRHEGAFYLALYEFYMFAVRSSDDGLRYRLRSPQEPDGVRRSDEWRSFPLPWNRRWHDGLWNPEHELKKALRHVAHEIRLAGCVDVRTAEHLGRWLRSAVETYPSTARLEFSVIAEDSHATAESTRTVEADWTIRPARMATR